MAGKITDREFVDEDGAKLWVQAGWSGGKVVLDTDPDSPGVDSTVLLTREQVQELMKFLERAGE